jgi:hypothetical protein
MFQEQHERLMRKAIAAGTAARAARWRALVIACQIEKLVAAPNEMQDRSEPGEHTA